VLAGILRHRFPRRGGAHGTRDYRLQHSQSMPRSKTNRI